MNRHLNVCQKETEASARESIWRQRCSLFAVLAYSDLQNHDLPQARDARLVVAIMMACWQFAGLEKESREHDAKLRASFEREVKALQTRYERSPLSDNPLCLLRKRIIMMIVMLL